MSAEVLRLSPYLVLLLVGFLPHELWRALGLVMSRGLNEDSEVVVLARAVATSIIAGVISKLMLFPPGALAEIPLALRVAAAATGLAVFMLARRSVFAGVAAGEAVLIAGALLIGR